MSQYDFNFPLTDFELETAKAHVLFCTSKGAKESNDEFDIRVINKLNSDKFQQEVKVMVNRWNTARVKLGFIPFK